MPSARYEAVAASRPRIRRDVLFTETPDGVLFHNADGGFRLTAKSAYRFATLLVPHLNGEHTVAEICKGFGDRQRAMVGELVGTLYERQFARSVPPRPSPEAFDGPEPSDDVARRYAAQIAYADHYADDAARRFQRFRDTRVAVVGSDLVARWCVLSLLRNGSAAIGVLPRLDLDGITDEATAADADGCPVDIHELAASAPLTWAAVEGYDVVVVTGGPEAPRVVFPLLRAGVPTGRTLIPAWSFGRHAIVGPSMSAQTTGCWACAVLRLGTGDGAAQAADVWSSLALDLPTATQVPGVHPGRPLAAMLGNLLGYEVFKTATGALPAETAGQLIIQDMESLDVTSEPLLPHPRCPWCADDAEADSPEIDLASLDTGALALPTVDTAREADALVEELNRRSVLLRPHAGVFTGYDDEDITQTPLKLSVVELGLGHGHTRRIGAADVHHVAGARLRALHRAAETYAEHTVPHRRTGAPEPSVRLAPAGFGTWTGIGDAQADVRGWVAATSLLTKERFLVPEGAVRPFGAGNRDRLFEATRAGMSAGASATDAAAQGMLSALAYDALQRAIRGSGVPGVAVPADADPELTFLLSSAANLGVETELLDLGERERSGVAVVLARSGARWAVAAELSYPAAAAAALRDLVGEVQLEQQGLAQGTSYGDPLLSDFDPRALAVTGTVTVTAGATEAPSWTDVLRRLGEQRRDALVTPTGSADLERAGVHVVRVLLTSEARRVA
ncbi:TOMM precursor leader peptide-binding protein [Streptomyces sp. NPDC058985]|uniref:TOMM precursor leader peptide-binding protein n=1 Tax=Streptomyces sp. NPDC058985 TaxID=3346684 RepID=UPI003695C792